MNEVVFILHILCIAFALLYFLKKGKSALIAVSAFLAVLANIFVFKQIQLFGLQVTCSDALMVGSVLAIGLLQEYYGEGAANQAIKISFGLLFFFAILSQIHLIYQPSTFDQTQSSFQTILGLAPRIVFASFVAFYVMQKCNVYVLQLMKNKFSSLHFPARLMIAGGISQVIDTLLFGYLGLYGVVHSLYHIFVLSLILKIGILLIHTPILSLSKRFAPEKSNEPV